MENFLQVIKLVVDKVIIIFVRKIIDIPENKVMGTLSSGEALGKSLHYINLKTALL